VQQLISVEHMSVARMPISPPFTCTFRKLTTLLYLRPQHTTAVFQPFFSRFLRIQNLMMQSVIRVAKTGSGHRLLVRKVHSPAALFPSRPCVPPGGASLIVRTKRIGTPRLQKTHLFFEVSLRMLVPSLSW
jgi:hypothetical protein